MSDLSEDQRQKILDSIKSGRKIEAIKLYRETSGAGLKEAKDFIEELTNQLLEDDPDAIQSSGSGCGTAMIVFALGVAGLLWRQFA